MIPGNFATNKSLEYFSLKNLKRILWFELFPLLLKENFSKNFIQDPLEIFLTYGAGFDDLHLMVLSNIISLDYLTFLFLKVFFLFLELSLYLSKGVLSSLTLNHLENIYFQKPFFHLGSSQGSYSSSFHPFTYFYPI